MTQIMLSPLATVNIWYALAEYETRCLGQHSSQDGQIQRIAPTARAAPFLATGLGGLRRQEAVGQMRRAFNADTTSEPSNVRPRRCHSGLSLAITAWALAGSGLSVS